MTSTFRPVHELAAEIAARRLSPVDLVDDYLARIERLEPRLHAFVSVNATHARLAAEVPLELLRNFVRETLKKRDGWLGQPGGYKREMTIHSDGNPSRPVPSTGRLTDDLLDALVGPTSG